MAYVIKSLSLRDWMIFCQRYGSGFLEAVTGAQKGDAAWEEAHEILHAMANDGVVLHSQGVTLKFLETPAKIRPAVRAAGGAGQPALRQVLSRH